MSQSVGDLFVNLGIKGADKTVGALSSVSKGMGEVKSMSIEAKAAIAGALYGLERLVANSGTVGTGLMNLTALTGISTRSLQQWEWGMRQAGGSAQEMDGIFKNLQRTMTMTDFNKGVPEGFAILSKAAGGIDWKQKLDPVYMAGKMRDAIKNMDKLLPKERIGLTNYLAGSMGLTDNFISMVRRGFADDKFLSRAPIYSPGQLKSLSDADRGWTNLGIQIERAIGQFNAKHGKEIVDNLSKVTKSVIALAEALQGLAEKYSVLQGLANILTNIANALDLTKHAPDILFQSDQDVAKGKQFHGGFWDAIKGLGKNDIAWTKDFWSTYLLPNENDQDQHSINKALSGIKPIWDSSYRHAPPTVNVPLTVNFYSPDNAPHKTANEVKKAVSKSAGHYMKTTGASLQGS